jgi:hypothetical protein
VESTATFEAFAVRVPAAVASQIEIASGRRSPEVVVTPYSAEPAVAADPGGGSVVTVRGLAGDLRLRVGVAAAGAAP